MALSTPALVGTALASTSNVASYTYASSTPSGSAAVLMFVGNSKASAPDAAVVTDTPTWLDGSWTLEADVTTDTNLMRLQLYSGKTIASPSADAFNVTFGANQTGCIIIVIEIATGYDATDFCKQPGGDVPTGAGLNLSASLAGALTNADSASIMFFVHCQAEDQVAGGGGTEITGSDVNHTGPQRSASAQYAINDISQSCSWATSQTRGVVYCEVAAASAAAEEIPFLVAARR